MPKHLHRSPLPLIVLLVLVCCGSALAITPKRHGDFAHYTFALTWQPGFCSSGVGCADNQSTRVLIGLHGLWASRPQGLIRRGYSAPQWWRRGCDFYHHSDRPPPLSAATRRKLLILMPHLPHSLLRHEYDKHVQCFGFDAEQFFRTELRLRKRIVDSPFGHYLAQRARGHRVRHAQVTAAFMRAFGTREERALQLRCGTNRHGYTVLTQMWITFHSDAVERFPHPGSLMNAPTPQDNCPANFMVPDWPKRSGT